MHRTQWILTTTANRAYTAIQSRFMDIINGLWVYTLGFYVGSLHFIQDVIMSGFNTFNQGPFFWLAMIFLLACFIMALLLFDLYLYYVMFVEVINPVDVLTIIRRYLTNRPSTKSMTRIYKRVTHEEFFDLHAVIMVLIYFSTIIIFFGFSVDMYRNYVSKLAARRHHKLKLSKLRRHTYSTGYRWKKCVICLQEYDNNDQLYIFPRHHVFHMECSSRWLIGQRSCPICRHDIFLTYHGPNKENNGDTATEETSLIRDHQIEHQTTHSLGAAVSDYTHPINESSGFDADGEDVSILPRQSTVNRITTTDLVFDQPQTNSQRHSHPQLPPIILGQSSPEEKDNNNITTTTSYGSVHDSPSESFTTPRVANNPRQTSYTTDNQK